MAGFGCDNCTYLSGKRCRLWQVKVSDARNQTCESGHNGDYNRKDVTPVKK